MYKVMTVISSESAWITLQLHLCFLCKDGEDPGPILPGPIPILDLSSDLKSGKTSVKECKEALLMCSKGCIADAGRPERKEHVYKKE